MSVALFGAEELGNVAAWLSVNENDLGYWSGLLAAYSVGNAAAFRYRYPNAEPVKAVHIGLVLAWAQTAVRHSDAVRLTDAARARGTVLLLSYNGPEGEGLESFKGQTAYRKAMLVILSRAFSKTQERQS